MKRLLITTLLFLSVLSGARAQTVATVTGHEIFPSAGPPTNGSVCFSLQNFKPNIPRIASTGIVIQQQNWCITPSTVDGSFSVPIVRNDAITPSGTYWRVDFLWNGLQQSSANYLINHTPFNLDVEVPLNQIPVIGPNQIITQVFSCPQLSASTTWTCTHNFNDTNVQVQTYDSSGHVIYPDTVVTTNPNVVTITFVAAQSGLAVIVHAGSIAIATNQPNAVLQNPTGTQSVCCFTTTFSSPTSLAGGGTLTGTFSGNPTLSGNVTITGALTGSSPGQLSGTWLGNPTFTGVPNFSGGAVLNGPQITAPIFAENSTLAFAGSLGARISFSWPDTPVSFQVSLPSASGTFVLDTATQTLSGKTLTSPTINNATENTPTIGTPIINGATTGTGVQGTDPTLLTAGTISASTGAVLCTDANHGATTSGCSNQATLTDGSISGNVTINNTATNIKAISVVFPSSGCPCRAFLSYSLYLDFTGITNQANIDFWVDDGGGHVMAGVETGQSNATTGAKTSATYGGFSNVTYANGANVTFTLKGIQPGTAGATVQAAPHTGSGPNSDFQVTVMPSVN